MPRVTIIALLIKTHHASTHKRTLDATGILPLNYPVACQFIDAILPHQVDVSPAKTLGQKWRFQDWNSAANIPAAGKTVTSQNFRFDGQTPWAIVETADPGIG